MSPPEPSRAELEDWDRRHVWHPFTQMAEYEPLILVSGQGCTLTDLDGRTYLDGVSSLWCNVHGHRHPKLDAAIRAQLGEVAHTTLLGAANPTTIRLARRLAELAPAGLEKVFFSDDGATAVEVALKMALQYWRQCPAPRPEKCRYVALTDAYHGDTLGDVSVGGIELFHRMFRPLLFETLRVPAPNLFRRPEGVARDDALAYYLGAVEELLARDHARIAALVVEPLVQGAAGMLVHPSGYLKGLRELTSKYDVLLIADEVAVGMGRTGTLFACEQEDVVPDFLCLAKGLTGGYLPLAATLTHQRIWDAFLGSFGDRRSFYHGHTFGGNPLGAAVALATLEVFEEEQTLARLPDKVACLQAHLARIAERPHVGDVRSRGLMAGIELVRDRATNEPYPYAEKWGYRVCSVARRHGVLLRPLGNVIVLLPPLSIREPELNRLCEVVDAAIREVTESTP